MTTLIEAPKAEAVRCDRCRLLWPLITGADLGWLVDEQIDLHLCPRCSDHATLTPDERAALLMGSSAPKRRLALEGPGSSRRAA